VHLEVVDHASYAVQQQHLVARDGDIGVAAELPPQPDLLALAQRAESIRAGTAADEHQAADLLPGGQRGLVGDDVLVADHDLTDIFALVVDDPVAR
jgi:hypothetical protein